MQAIHAFPRANGIDAVSLRRYLTLVAGDLLPAGLALAHCWRSDGLAQAGLATSPGLLRRIVNVAMGFYQNRGKRWMDILVSGSALLLAAPILAVTALVVRTRLGRPIFFRQRRIGLYDTPFCIWKFRTMIEACDPTGAPLPDERRLTRVGRLLRASSLDELPGLWNVMRGEMSLVGPRPLLTEYRVHYSPRQRRRHDVRPGITGLAQVRGRNAIDWATRLEMDVWYVDHLSFALDVRILLKTIKCVFLSRDIHADGHATMPRFDGAPAAGVHHDRAA